MMIKRIKAILLTTALVAAMSGLAVAQNGDYRDNDRGNDNRGNHDQDSNRQWGQNRNADAHEYGFHNGYRAGFDRGRNFRNTRGNNGGYNNDGYRRDRMNDADGYQASMGARGQYKKGYREGYSSGYNDASNNRPVQYPYVYGQSGQRTPWDPDGDGRPGTSNNNSNNYYGTAARFGTEDGQVLGRSDRQSGHSSRPTEWKAYRDADHGMSSASGYSSDQYKEEYRQAFVAGYNQGYGYNR
jgi:hypothetical protein